MRIIEKEADLPYKASQMFELVNDIESYPTYLPGCVKATILSRSPTEITAKIYLKRGGIEQSFSTRNIIKVNKSIEMNLLEGPFRHLKGLWLFEDLPISQDNTKMSRVRFTLEFVLANRLLDMAAGPVIEGMANTFLDSFRERALMVYGNQHDMSKDT